MSNPKIDFIVNSIRDQRLLGKQLIEIERSLRGVFSDEEIASAMEIVKESSRKNSQVQQYSLTDNDDPEEWYLGPNLDEDSHWSLLKSVLKNKRTRPWDEEKIASLDFASTNVVSHLAPPKSQTPKAVRGLVLGYVQSGKTANFSAVISKSVDAGYKLVVVLAGMHNILRLQTQERLNEEIVEPKKHACTTLTDVDENGDFQKKQFNSATRALSTTDGFVLVVLKKNASVLRNFNSWLDEANKEVLAKCPTLVIDDEADQASVNTNKPENNPTAINDHIRKILNRFPVISYVGYTATPFANVLIDSSVDDDLFPKDFIITLDKPADYVGTEELFGRDEIEPRGKLEGYPVLRTIPDSDSAAFGHKKGQKNNLNPMTDSLMTAIDSFILGCSARLARNQWKQHMTMLLHTSHLTGKHFEYKDQLDAYLLELKLARQDEDSELKDRLQSLWESDFLTVSNEFKIADDFKFETVWRNSKKFLERIQLVVENHASEERLTYKTVDPFWGIVIGGNTLSRGLTLEGLTTSYFIRGSKGYDTLLQMGRWFGYRPGYVDLTRVFVTDDLHAKFYHLATVEQEIRDEIKTMAANKERPIHVGLKVRTHPVMTVTSNLKMRTAESCTLTYSASKVQALYVNTSDKQILDHNFKTAVELIDGVEKFGSKQLPVGFEDLNRSLLYRDVNPELILQFIEKFNFSSGNIRFTPKLISNYIQDLIKVGELNKWSVAVMSPKKGIEVNLGNDRSVFKVERSIVKGAKSDLDINAKHIKVLTTPGDELVDLHDLFEGGSLRNTDDLLKKSDDQKVTEVLLRQKHRPKSRGLLLLYVINPNLDLTDVEYSERLNSPRPTVPVKAASDVIGVSFVFPETTNSKGLYRYVVNGSI